MSLNWRRGFNRIFVLAAVGWAIYVLLVYPTQQRAEAAVEYSEHLRHCAETAPIMHDYRECLHTAKDEHDAVLEWYSPQFQLTNGGPALVLLCILVLPPATAYGLFRLGWVVLAWVMRGFQ